MGVVAAGALAASGLSTVTAVSAAAATPAGATYTVTVGSTGNFGNPDDSPADGFIDKDGTFHYQSSHADYAASAGRAWDFFTGTDFDTATADTTLDDAVNPANSEDKNNDTTWRCNNSPTGLEATYAPTLTTHAEANYCDLIGIWVDPDTGDWYGLVHNEFTPEPYGDDIHFDDIDYAVSTDQGQVWTIEGHAITSPYATEREDGTAFPNQTYDYGDGDPRLFVDTASGYFYVFYGSRLVDKGGVWQDSLEHVARSPIADKMATGSWEKYDDGSWSQPGIGGLESNLVPVGSTNPDGSANNTGYTPSSAEYSPSTTGTVEAQIAANEIPSKSPLFAMNIAYDAYLGLYIGEPEVVNTSTPEPQQFYVTDNLATEQWRLVGDTGSFTSDSWYRWFVDSASATLTNSVVGENFRSYCAVSCNGTSGGQYANITLDSSSPAPYPFSTTEMYQIATGDGQILAQVSGGTATASQSSSSGSMLQDWTFVPDGDGSYQILNAATGELLGVDASTTASRSWGSAPTVTASGSTGATVGQQWWIIADTDSATGSQTGSYRLVNRYSGLVLALTTGSGASAETTPARYWSNATGNSVGGSRTANEQTLTITAVGAVTGTVTLASIGTQNWTEGSPVSIRANATSSTGQTISYSASGLPAGVSIASSTGLISGDPTSTGSGKATVTATAGGASNQTTFSWTVAAGASLNGTHVLSISGNALDDPNWSTSEGTQLDTWTANGGANQNWVFTEQSDGSYQIENAYSNLCMDDDGGFTTVGDPVIQWACTGNSNQHWTVALQPNGSYELTNVNSGLLLSTASTKSGALVTQQTNTGSSLQQWALN
ncbi:RICIN domain-containing protein [Actinospica sp. MGRD01-02]|uniref:RICIN domain-containing protein n=1 Tax=Actinospica acidithermotolerans TaxID=2828514 RepID=A0A941IGY6_9ACTN|nr:RICIN domain-containing protein [Actinospica acidithermotolerans]